MGQALYIHPATQRLLRSVAEERPHALLISGPAGIGLRVIAAHEASQAKAVIYTVAPQKNDVVDYESGVIGIEQVRNLYDLTKTREPNGRTIIIDDADRMGAPAQNAFLKLLEEPTEGTRFVLLSHSPERLLPTIRSRVQHIAARPISTVDSEALIDTYTGVSAEKRAQLLFIASGLPAELVRLLESEDAFQARVQFVKDARTFITGSPYARLLLASKYKDSRNGALLLIEDAVKQLQRTVAQKGDEASITLLRELELLYGRLNVQGNVRLQLSSAVLL